MRRPQNLKKISLLFWQINWFTISKRQNKREFFTSFVAFSQCLNFIHNGMTSFPKVHLCTVFAIFVSLISKLEKLHNNTTSERIVPHCFNVNDFTRVDNEWNYQVFVPHDLSCLSLRVIAHWANVSNFVKKHPLKINFVHSGQ